VKLEVRAIKKVWVANLVLAVLAIVLILPSVVRLYPPLVGADTAYTVLSGSMSPALEPRDIVFVRRMAGNQIDVGDIVTVESEGSDYTHRVVEKKLVDETYVFRLKGDANEDPDPSYVKASSVVGKVGLTLPCSILFSPPGYVLIVLAPLALLALNQVINIYKFTNRSKRRRRGFKAILLGKGGRRKRRVSTLDTTSVLLFTILIVGSILIMAPFFAAESMSWFSDTETAYGEFTAGHWVIDAIIDIAPDTLNLNSQGQVITVYTMIETEYDENDIDVGTVILDDVVYAEWGEVQGDGRLMVKFDRSEVIAYLIEEGYESGDVTLTVTGEFTDGVRFIGEDTIRVIT
jgi:signal peptidase I